jgi:AhpD family alkylhydroperoxidase
MARITMKSPEQMDTELRELTAADSRTPLELGNVRIYAHRPALAKAYVRFMGEMRGKRELPARLVELVRLRVAFHNQCRSCMAIRYADAVADGLGEDLVCQLASPGDSPDLTPAERAALEFADLVATNHLGITDATIDGLRNHFGDDEIVELGMNIAVFVGFGRLSMAWDMVDELPDRFRDRSGARITPWGEDDAIVVGSATPADASAAVGSAPGESA